MTKLAALVARSVRAVHRRAFDTGEAEMPDVVRLVTWTCAALAMVACAPAAEMAMDPDAGPAPIAFPELVGASGVLEDLNPDPHVVEVELRARYTQNEIAPDLRLDLDTYNGLFPGPVLQAAAGDEVIVHFTNEMPEDTTVHWHGLRIPDEMDGSPRIQEPVAPEGGTFTYRFVVPEAGTFWYHPHVRANEQVEFGLAAPIVIRDRNDPEYDAERLVVLDDMLVDPETGLFEPFLRSHPELMHGRWGNVLLTNGRADVQRQSAEQGMVERWRLINTANARTMTLSIEGARFRVIGTDGGLLREPYEVSELTLAVGQRRDLELVYEGAGEVTMYSHILALDEAGEVVTERVPVYVVDVAASDRTPRTIVWPEFPGVPERGEDTAVDLEFDAVEDPTMGIAWRINGMSHWEEPMFTFGRGQTVRMRLRNLAGPEHPFHLHGQFFSIVDDGRPETPGLHDTVLVPGLTTLEIIAYLDNPGRWMAHCHILEHAELGMMAEIVVGDRE